MNDGVKIGAALVILYVGSFVAILVDAFMFDGRFLDAAIPDAIESQLTDVLEILYWPLLQLLDLVDWFI